MKNVRMFKFGDIVIKSGVKSGYLLTERPNTETGNVTQNVINYIDTDGADYRDVFFAPRDFEVKGAILFWSEAEKLTLKHKLITACNPKNKMDLSYFNGRDFYYAQAMAAALPEFGEEMRGVLPFVISMRIPGFYWLSNKEIANNVFIVTKLLRSAFTLPTVFSTRVNRAVIVNDGGAQSYPTFTIVCNEDADVPEIKIENKTTGKMIKLIYTAALGEIITINHEDCVVTSSVNGNIIKYVAADSDFFAYEPGLNDIECNLPGASVTSRYRCRYLGV